MDRDYNWEGEYGRRSHLIPVFQQLLREQDASSLQMLSLFVNNNPYNLEFFIAYHAGHGGPALQLCLSAG